MSLLPASSLGEYKSPRSTENDILILIIYLCLLFIRERRVCITLMYKCVSRDVCAHYYHVNAEVQIKPRPQRVY